MDKFNRSYFWLSLLFIVYFYIVPLSLVSYSGIDWYVGYKLNINKSDIYLSWVSIFIFLLGCVFFDFFCRFLKFKKIEIEEVESRFHKNRVNMFFWFFLLIYACIAICLKLQYIYKFHNASLLYFLSYLVFYFILHEMIQIRLAAAVGVLFFCFPAARDRKPSSGSG